MALNIVDAEGRLIPTAPPPNPTPDNTPYFYEQRSYPSWLLTDDGRINPNLIQALAGIGAEMDPRGAGGILGRAAINLSQMTAAQRADKEQQQQFKDYNKRLFQILGGWGDMSPPGEAGPSKISMKPNRTVSIEGNLANDGVPAKGTGKPAGGEIIQTNTTPEARNREMPPMAPDTPAGILVTNDDPGRVGKQSVIGRGKRPFAPVPNTPMYSMPPKGQPIPAVPTPAMIMGTPPMELPPRPNNQPYDAPTGTVLPNQQRQSMTTPGTESQPEPMPGVDVTAQAQKQQAIQGLAGAPQTVVIPTYNPPKPVTPQFVQPPATPTPPIVGGGGITLPANSASLLPTSRRRSQTMFDLRDSIPF